MVAAAAVDAEKTEMHPRVPDLMPPEVLSLDEDSLHPEQ